MPRDGHQDQPRDETAREENGGVPVDPARAVPRETWNERRLADLPSPELLDHLRMRVDTDAPGSALRLLNPVLFVGSPEMANTFGKVCDLKQLHHPDDIGGIDWSRADALVIEARIHRYDVAWRRAILNLGSAGRALDSLITAARAHRVPIALWITEEPKAAGMFGHLFDLADLIVCHGTAPDVGEKALVVDGYVDASVYNPLVADKATREYIDPLTTLAIEGAWEIGAGMTDADRERLLTAISDWNWWLVDSSYELRNNSRKLPAPFRRRFLGSMTGDAIGGVMRASDFYLIPDCVRLPRPGVAAMRALQARACGTVVLYEGEVPEAPGVIGGMIGDALSRTLAAGVDDPIGRMAQQHLAWRSVMSQSTAIDVLMQVLQRMGVEATPNEAICPLVNVVMPTNRPELIARSLRTWAAQTYPAMRLTIVLNADGIPPEVARLVDETEFASVHHIPPERTIGYCVNYGRDVVDAPYWAKVDDDDIYGRAYLADMMLQRKYTDFDLTGKFGHFAYFEALDRVFARHPFSQHTGEIFLTGGSLISKASSTHFPEDIRGFADTMYLLNSYERGGHLLSADMFNFLQIRREDPRTHTWTAAAHTVNLKGYARNGVDPDTILI